MAQRFTYNHSVQTFDLRLLIRQERRVTLLDDDGVQAKFHLSPLHNPLLHCVFSDETEDAHLLLLTDSVSSVLK